MFPMVADSADFERARNLLKKVHDRLEKEGRSHLWPIQTGIMIEIPSAAMQAESLAAQVDFFSIGTNDLTQYTLAADRGNPALGSYQDALHPAVLRLMAQVIAAGRAHRRMVAVCGEAAADEVAALIFVGLGVEELSMSQTQIPHIKSTLRTVKATLLEELARRALLCDSANEVRQLANQMLKEQPAPQPTAAGLGQNDAK
jgi:phosphocarrier protein FPr